MASENGVNATIAIIDGVRFQIFYNDHAPPHLHATLGNHEALVAIRNLDWIRRVLPPAKLRRVMGWTSDLQGELALNWLKCQNDQPPERI